MGSLEEIEAAVRLRWSPDPAADLCVKLISYLLEQPEERLRMLTFQSIGSILDREPLDEDVLRAVAILVSSSIHALEKRLLFIEEDDEEREYELEQEEIELLNRDGVFIHPDTGQKVADPEAKLVPFFVPSENILRLKAELDG